MQDRYYSDEELVAYLDGEADLAPLDEITEALKTDAALARRLDALRVDTAAIAAGFGHLAERAPAPPTQVSTAQLPGAANSNIPWASLAAAVLLSLLVGFGSATYLAPTAPPPQQVAQKPGWKKYVAAYQALYTNSTLAHVAQAPEMQQAELKRVSDAIGKEIPLEALTQLPELSYKRSQILGFRGKALAQIAFLSSTGQPLALCIIRTQKGNSDGVQASMLEDMSAASWTRDGYDYLLIGGEDTNMVTRLAEHFADAI